MFYWLTSTERLDPLCWSLSSIVGNRGRNGPLWNSVCESRGAPAKELEWANMGLGFRRTTHRASETQILEPEKWTGVSVNISTSLWNMWTGHVSRVNYLQTSCYPMRIWSGVWICEKYSLSSCNKESWTDEWLKPLSWRQEIIEAHVTLLTSLVKNSNFSDKAADDEMSNISKHSDPVWQVLHHRVTYRAVIPKIGHILSPSERANQKHPTMQIKRQLKKRQSKI